nr:hypothetical protein [Gemmatimonadota bacterium]
MTEKRERVSDPAAEAVGGTGRKTRLGKGLSALLGEYLPEEATQTDRGYRSVDVALIAPNPFQPRRDFTSEQL